MSSEYPPKSDECTVEVKLTKKERNKLDRTRKRQEAAAAAGAVASGSSIVINCKEDPLVANYGEVPLINLQSSGITDRRWTNIKDVNTDLEGNLVLVRGNIQAIRHFNSVVFVVVREQVFTLQCVVLPSPDVVSKQMLRFVAGLTNESVLDVEGIVCIPKQDIKNTSQEVELHVSKLFCVNKSAALLPISIEDASRCETEKGSIKLDTRLNHRVLDLRTPAKQSIVRVGNRIDMILRDFLRSEDFVYIITPKLIAGISEGGSSVFKLDYYGQQASLAQSPQLHKQMAIAGGFSRVFVVGPKFRSEKSFTNRHLCEFTGIDIEMEVKEHYSEVMDIVDRLFVRMFDYLNETCMKELAAIRMQFPSNSLKYLRNTLRLTFEEGVQMLKDAGFDMDPLQDISTKGERVLAELVLKKYGTDFFILHRYPLVARPFFTMPCADDPRYSNSFDAFIRGEEIISGSQRVHIPEMLIERLTESHIAIDSAMSAYIDSFRYGVHPHGGFGAGLERIIMLFCDLKNIRHVSLFPRDANRLVP